MSKVKARPLTRKPGETRGRKPAETVQLTMHHNINGTGYGPGPARVTAGLAEVLREQEQNFYRVERYLHEQGAAIIGAGGKLLKVRPGYFDQALGSSEPMIQIAGDSR